MLLFRLLNRFIIRLGGSAVQIRPPQPEHKYKIRLPGEVRVSCRARPSARYFQDGCQPRRWGRLPTGSKRYIPYSTLLGLGLINRHPANTGSNIYGSMRWAEHVPRERMCNACSFCVPRDHDIPCGSARQSIFPSRSCIGIFGYGAWPISPRKCARRHRICYRL